jgi:hypothetical protein
MLWVGVGEVGGGAGGPPCPVFLRLIQSNCEAAAARAVPLKPARAAKVLVSRRSPTFLSPVCT